MNASFTLFSIILFWKRAEPVNNYNLHSDRDTAAFQSRSLLWKKKRNGTLKFRKGFRNLLDSFVKQFFKLLLKASDPKHN